MQATSARRFLIAALVVAAGELVLALAAIPTGLAPYLAACALATAALGLAAHRLLVPSDEGPGDGPGPDAGPETDPPPPWWPAFEDAFREHARERDRESLAG